MRIALAGSSGLIGAALADSLRGDGHDVVRLVRRPAERPDEVRWDPSTGRIDADSLGVVDAAVNLCGAGVGDARWTATYRRVLHDSRIDPTRTLSVAMARMEPRPRVLLNASGIGAYGDTGERPADESAPLGETFLAAVVRDWEAATAPASDAGIRVVHLRTGLVVASGGGAFGKLWPLAKLGVLGRLGSGKQWWSWIALEDHIAAMRFLLQRDDLSGPVNVVSPTPTRNADVTKAIARAVHRPAVMMVPSRAVKLVLGGFAEELLVSQRVVPAALQQAGFPWKHTDIDSAAQAYAP
jgi:hypothetical protein